ncbi:MAG: hypothetical protein JNK37_05275 [Verrucomicrobiales bacterium]|nr:hypothetical protein [Verrucomicrobiales bacterium]
MHDDTPASASIRDILRRKREIWSELVFLAREVDYSGETECWPPGGRHVRNLFFGWGRLREPWLADGDRLPAETHYRLLAGSLDLGKLIHLLYITCKLRQWEARKADAGDASTHSTGNDIQHHLDRIVELLNVVGERLDESARKTEGKPDAM